MFATVREAEFDPIPAGLDEMEPGPALGAALAGIDVDRVSEYDRVVILVARQRLVSHHQAQLQRDMMSIVEAYRSHDGDPHDLEHAAGSAATEIRVALGLTRRAADAEVELAYLVYERVPAVWEGEHGALANPGGRPHRINAAS